MKRSALSLLRQFVSAVRTAEEIPQSEISTIVQQLCDKAPGIARIFVEEALKRIDVDIYNDTDASPRRRKRKRILDPSYRPLRASNVEKPSKVRAAESPAEEPAGESTTINGDSSFAGEISPNQISVMAEAPIPWQEVNGGGESNSTETLSKIEAASPDRNTLHHDLSTAKDACNERNESRPETGEMQLDEPKVRQATHERGRGAGVLSDPCLSTPSPPDHLEMQPSPQTEEVPRPDVSLVLESSAPESPSPHPYVEHSFFYDMLAETITVIEMMSKKTEEALPGAHSAILRALPTDTIWAKTDKVEASESAWSATDMRSWSALMWIRLLEEGQSRSKTTIILNQIEEMGAAVWYEAQLRQIAGSGLVTKRGKPRVRVASALLDSLLRGDGSNPAQEQRIQERATDIRRQMISKAVSRGNKLRTIVSKTSLGILFRPKIWEYLKMKDDEFEKIAENFQADPRQVQLLSILGEQVQLLVDEGRPNLSSFFASLESNLVVTPEEASRLYADFGLETNALPAGSLDADIDRLVEKVRDLLGKQEFGEYDYIMINGEVNFPCDSLHRLRPGRWLDMWSIAAAMEMTDKHRSVRYGLSVDLDEVKEDGVVPKLRPLGLWRKKVDQYRKKAAGVPLIYLCPLNLNANHFTLLEINEQVKMIYHYDSMANRRIIQRKTKTSRVRQVVEEEFGYLGSGYEEAVCKEPCECRSR
ncbi:hypothetical protein C8A03DRAFT_38303 [Achaetomium macrosporum]|uniref:Ubiquitin-like protease family profile domain-containing protein n=1 Tax=Achaetomium macrosporum TaxID=79813 RepID=A0AAN7C2Q7_9PEZI|nr:hypothetical protein C8A03DRAFT_38303 [Achaetomium macrosporum]